MGFLSKLMKNPLVQMAAPMALSAAFPMFAGSTGLAGLFSKMNPMAANALKQSLLGYGTAALSGSRRPGRAAMAAGLTSIPFSYMSAANAANAFNDRYAGIEGASEVFKPGSGGYFKGPMGNPMGATAAGKPRFVPRVAKQFAGYQPTGTTVPEISAYDILSGDTRSMTIPDYINKEQVRNIIDPSVKGGYKNVGKLIPGEDIPLKADIFSKPEMQKMKFGDDVFMSPTGEYKTDFLPTAVSQAAGLYAGRDTPEEEWEAAKKRRRKELAFMYGVDEDQIGGEMDNPFYTGPMMNAGGIASLNMDMGGGVSGPGGPKDDMIDAKLSDGEFVMTAKAVENFGNGDRMAGARKMYDMMNMLDPESEAMNEVV